MGPDEPAPRSWDDVVAWLRARRASTGHPTYAELARRVQLLRVERGDRAPIVPGRTTVFDCFSDGRRRMDVDLVADLGRALGLTDQPARAWAEACFAVQNRIESARVVSVSETVPQTPYFVGRVAELSILRGEPTTARVVTGMAGIGKTQLALRAAQSLLHAGGADRILVADLRGHHESRPAADGEAMLDELLRILTGAATPSVSTIEGRRALLGEALADRRCVLILDDAADAEQIAVLTPLPGTSLVVTSRTSLSLPGLEEVRLDALSRGESLQLMRLVVGDPPMREDPESAEDIVDRLGHHPLAIDLTSRRIAATSGWSLRDHRDALHEQTTMLRLPTGVETTLDLSLRSLGDDERRLLRLLADQPCRSLDSDAAAALTGTSIDSVRDQLGRLADAHLVQRSTGRFRLHHLVRIRVAAEAMEMESPSVRAAARRRLLEHVVTSARRAVTAADLSPMQGADWFSPLVSQLDAERAMTWLIAERENLLVLAHPDHNADRAETVLDLSVCLSRFFDIQGCYADGAILHRLALSYARRCCDVAAEARAGALLGSSLVRLGDNADGVVLLERALQMGDAGSDPDTHVNALNALAVAAIQTGDFEAGLDRLQQALAVVEAGDTVRTPASLLGNIAVVQLRLGDLESAARSHELALRSADAHGDRPTGTNALSNLSEVHLLRGDAEAAASSAREALARDPEPGAEGAIRSNLGQALAHLGRFEEARNEHRVALRVLRSTGERHAEASVLNNLGETELAEHDALAAAAAFELAGTLSEQLGDRYEDARHHEGLARVADLKDDVSVAFVHRRAALLLYDEIGAAESQRVRAELDAG